MISPERKPVVEVLKVSSQMCKSRVEVAEVEVICRTKPRREPERSPRDGECCCPERRHKQKEGDSPDLKNPKEVRNVMHKTVMRT